MTYQLLGLLGLSSGENDSKLLQWRKEVMEANLAFGIRNYRNTTCKSIHHNAHKWCCSARVQAVKE